MNIAFIVFLSLFCVTSCVHLYFCFVVNEKLRKITKPFCLAFLSIAVTCLIPNYPLVYCALYMGFVGDIFLLFPKKSITFSFGTVSFFIGHVLFSIQMLISLSYVMPWWFYAIEGALWVGISLAFIPAVKKQTGKIAYIGNFYILFLVVALSIGIIFTVDN